MPEQGLHIKLTKLAADVKDSNAAKAAHFLPAKTFWQDKVKMWRADAICIINLPPHEVFCSNSENAPFRAGNINQEYWPL